MIEKLKNISFPVIITLVYIGFFYFCVSFYVDKELLLSIRELSSINVGPRFILDFIASLLVIIVILVKTLVRKRPLSDFGLTVELPVITAILLVIYAGLFFYNGDFSLIGFYTAFFYLVIVAFSEEFVFRGFLFTSVNREYNFWVAAITSGLLWGAAHAVVPIVIHGGDIVASVLNELGGGIAAGTGFAFLYKKSRTLFVPVLIHAILDYSGYIFRA